MLSEKHDTNTISFGLSEPLNHGISPPDEVVTDGSLALLNAVSLAYNNCSYTEYLSVSFNKLSNENVKLKPCYLRSDRAHIIKSVSRWTCFKGKSSKCKDFFTRCVGFSMVINDIKLLEEIVLAMFLISLSESFTYDSICQKKVEWLKKQFYNFDDSDLCEEKNYDDFEKIIGTEDASVHDQELLEITTNNTLVISSREFEKNYWL